MAKRRKPSAYVYRDKRTGRFVSKAKWKRSKSAGGTRYVRGKIKLHVLRDDTGQFKEKRPTVQLQPPIKQPPTTSKSEYVIDQSYKGKRARDSGALKIHIIAPTGLDKDAILNTVEQWTLSEPLPPGWTIKAIDWRTKEYEPQELQGMLRNMFGSGRLT